MAYATTLVEKKLHFYCDECFRDITTLPFIQCIKCSSSICLYCFFANFSECHIQSYKVVSNLQKPFLYPDWSMIEELLFLYGVSAFGIGNFEDISSIIFSKTVEKVREHFYQLFQIENSTEGEVPMPAAARSDPNDSEVLSYLSKREDFESEILYEYESIISSLSIGENDSAADAGLKRYMLRHYNDVMKQRRIWKSWILDRGLVDMSRIKTRDSLFLAKYKWLVKYISKSDFNVFMSGLLEERELKQHCDRHMKEIKINTKRLLDFSMLLSPLEKQFCDRLRISLHEYGRVKRIALESFLAEQPLLPQLIRVFGAQEESRINILYRWFSKHGIVVN